MSFVRVLGASLLVAALLAVSFDVHQILTAQQGYSITSVYDAWKSVLPGSLEKFGAILTVLVDPQIVEMVFRLLHLAPAALLLGLVGYALQSIGNNHHYPSERPNVQTGRAIRKGTLSELANALASCRQAFAYTALFSGASNILMLTGSIFMLQVYDRILPSRSIPTLVGLSALAVSLFIFQGIIDLIRGRILVRIGAALDEPLSGRVYETVLRLPLKAGHRNDGLQPLRDLDTVRSFLSGAGPAALSDLPWMPVYLGIVFAFHTWLGLTALAGAVILILLTLLTELFTRIPVRSAAEHNAQRLSVAETSRRNAEVISAMGMSAAIAARWQSINTDYIATQRSVSDIVGGFGAMSRTLRVMLQSVVLGVGAYLVLQQQATAGIIIAGSILTARALAPVDLAIANWRGFVAARQSWQRLGKLLAALPAIPDPMQLPAPRSTLSAEAISCVPPGGQRPTVIDVSMALRAGQGLAIIGPSGAGKSSLVRMLVGVWHPVRGIVRIDGAAIDQWAPTDLGRHIGYLPQDVELFAGTLAENISRFDPNATPEAIVAAAQAAGVHELILTQPKGYESQIGEHGAALSAGQRQRVALARALYRDPFLVVLDEPNSNLDSAGESALTQAILGIRGRGGIAVIVAHRASIMAGIDLVLAMSEGRTIAFGPKDEVLRKVLRPAQVSGGPAMLPQTATSPKS